MNTRKIAANIFILFFLLLQTLCVAQTEPIVSPMQVYICKGTGVVLDLSICPVSGAKFSWSIAGGGEISTSLTHRVTPTKTTSYLFKCIHPDGRILTKTVKVVVIEEVKLDGDVSDRLEESTLPFKAEILGEIPADLSIKYIFTWSTPTFTGSKEVVSNSKMINVDIKAPIIPLADADHKEVLKVSLQVKIGDKNICSSVEKQVNLIQLWIDYFRDMSSSKDWKIVIGNPIEFRINATSDCKCNWEIGGLEKIWDLNNAVSTGIVNDNLPINALKINYSSIHTRTMTSDPPNSLGFDGFEYEFTGKNSWLGDANGRVKVTCKDLKGNSKIRLLSDQQLVPYVTAVKIFFDAYQDFRGKDASHIDSKNPVIDYRILGVTSSNATEKDKRRYYFPPLWYLFWKEGNVIPRLNDLNVNRKPLFLWLETGPDALNTYGRTVRNADGTKEKIYLQDRATTQNFSTTQIDTRRISFTSGSGKGLQCLAETMRHELEHLFINRNWRGPGPIDISLGHSDIDGLPDIEEITASALFPKTDHLNADTYGIGYDPTSLYNYSDNELRCLMREVDISTVNILGSTAITYYQSLDWSNTRFNTKWKD